ncbi:MAG: hypothetical protein AB7F09_00390 [Parvibaculaceae bacterium]
MPDDYTGATAVVRDSSVNPAGSGQASAGHSQYFVLAAVDGKEVPNSFSQTFAGAEGHTNFQAHERKVPVRPLKVTLRAVAYFPNGLKGKGGASGLDEITTAATQKTVSFVPEAGETYVVRGQADERTGSAWIETSGGQRVTDVATIRQPGAAAQ